MQSVDIIFRNRLPGFWFANLDMHSNKHVQDSMLHSKNPLMHAG